jgi:hypothetical protein
MKATATKKVKQTATRKVEAGSVPNPGPTALELLQIVRWFELIPRGEWQAKLPPGVEVTKSRILQDDETGAIWGLPPNIDEHLVSVLRDAAHLYHLAHRVAMDSVGQDPWMNLEDRSRRVREELWKIWTLMRQDTNMTSLSDALEKLKYKTEKRFNSVLDEFGCWPLSGGSDSIPTRALDLLVWLISEKSRNQEKQKKQAQRSRDKGGEQSDGATIYPKTKSSTKVSLEWVLDRARSYLRKKFKSAFGEIPDWVNVSVEAES